MPPRDAAAAAGDSDSEGDEAALDWLLGFVEPPRRRSDLLRHRFPSKVGGRPAWLHPVALPTPAQTACRVTAAPMDFLLQVGVCGCVRACVRAPACVCSSVCAQSCHHRELTPPHARPPARSPAPHHAPPPHTHTLQVYAPLDDHPAAFHRTLFLFVSPAGERLAVPGAVRALRCQLPRDNAFYPPLPPAKGDTLPPELSGARQQ